MTRDFEIVGVGAIAGLLKRKERHAPPPGALCPNCGAELQGLYCHVCGQPSDDHHRHIGHLIWEGIEGLTHLDGRLAQTLPPLFFNPGKLARDHFEGRRQRHVPPFRLFLISLLIFMLVLEAFFNGSTKQKTGAAAPNVAVHGNTLAIATPGSATNVVFTSPEQAKALAQTLKDARAKGQAVDVATTVSAQKNVVSMTTHGQNPAAVLAAADAVNKAQGKPEDIKGLNSPLGLWLREHIGRAAANREYYSMVLFTWAHRLAILLLPILAGLLALVYVRRRKFFIYDHLIVAMQFLSFEFLVFAFAWLIPNPVRQWALLGATIWTPVNLYMTLRGAYGSRRITAGIKTLFLWLSTMTLFCVLMLGLMGLALAEM
jgi:hypothetical protein